MNDRADSLRRVAYLLGNFARQVELKRALERVDIDPHLNFWRLLYGGLTNLAVIEWCKLFGAEGSNELHWKRLFPDRIEEFREGLFAETGIDAAGFRAYWHEIKLWRDASFAHHEQGATLPPKWPHFDIALQSAEFYYRWVVEELDDAAHYLLPRDLKHYRQIVSAEYESAAVLALAATQNLPKSKH